jgi:hypothetical protein
MTRLNGRQIDTFVQVLNADGSPAISATVNCIVRFWDGEIWASGVMEYQANGIYKYVWTPDGSGHYTAECLSGNPVFRHTFEYYVIDAPYVGEQANSSQSGSQADDLSEHGLWSVNTVILQSQFAEATVIIYPAHSSLPLASSVILRLKYIMDGDTFVVRTASFPDDFGSDAQVAVLTFPVMKSMSEVQITIQNEGAQGSAIFWTSLYAINGIGNQQVSPNATNEED